jgi:FKBP-type peptidyl-prolyl cis-trans isomerase FkpA
MSGHLSLRTFSLILGISCLMLLSCCQQQKPEQNKISEEEIRERMTNVNRMMVQDESKRIEEFIRQRQWKMETTGTGLRIEIYGKGNGRQPEVKDTVSIAYKAYLLDGSLCYSTDETNPLKFILGQGEQIHGLEEGLQRMHESNKARLVVPSHLAFGMSGDGNKIPAASAIYYDVELLKVGN